MTNPNPPSATPLTSAEVNEGGMEALPAPAKKIVDINQPQICKNKGCGKTFTEKDNHDTACSYHPGPAVFHDRMRGVRAWPMLHFVYISHFSNAAFELWFCGGIHVKPNHYMLLLRYMRVLLLSFALPLFISPRICNKNRSFYTLNFVAYRS